MRITLRLTCLACFALLLLGGRAMAAEFGIEGKTLGELGLSEESIKGTGEPLLFEVPALGLEFQCKTEEDTGKMFPGGKGETTITLKACDLLPPFEEACAISEPLTLTLKTELTESETGAILEVETAKSGKAIGTVIITGAECPFIEIDGTLSGSMVSEFKAGGAAEHAMKYSAAFGKGFSFGASPVTLTGGLKLKLSGANAGKSLSILLPTLCKATPVKVEGLLFCPPKEGYAGTVTGSLATGNEFKLSNAEGTITCNEFSFSGKYLIDGRGTLESVTYKNSKAKTAGNCLVTRAGETEVHVELTKLPSTTSLFEYSPGLEPTHDAVMWWASEPSKLPMKITLKGGALGCFYEVHSSFGVIVDGAGGGASTLGLGAEWHRTKAEPGKLEECPAELTQSNATMNLARTGGNVYVTKR